MDRCCLSVFLFVLALTRSHVDGLKSDNLCRQCSKRDTNKCPASESYPHMTAFDDTLIAGALQSDYVDANDRGVYSVPDIAGGTSDYNAYFGWESTSGSASGFHRFRNYMDRCSGGQNYLTVEKTGKVRLRSLKSLESLGEADWKSINPPKRLNHQEFRFWVNRSTGKCLTVFEEKKNKRTVGVSECNLDGSNTYQLFAFRFHYHKAFCSCGVHNE
ncbi:hypothetical protein SADUNF_Sadunf07G0123700 [Salix dunnii]|uniref:Uncharacterized protein n=1 Tax=Salix dunnii TaxID=1413687 RepID=A0A835MUF2_9ROSI|nr:hypothetical protein SADUNF_Sadunf07G0123700 [Salix dunnii]